MPDILFAARMLRRNLGFAALAVTTLALGVGANTAIFSVVKAVLLNPLPYAAPDRLVAVAESSPDSIRPVTVDYTTTYDWRTRSRSFESMSLFRMASGALVEHGEPELIMGMRVGYDFFDTLGVKVAMGREFQPEEDRPESRYEVILSHGLWLRAFGGDPATVGRVIHLSESPFTVVGILPAGFEPLGITGVIRSPEMYMPLGYDLKQSFACRGCQHLHLVARMKSAVRTAEAQAELNTIMRALVHEHPDSYHPNASVVVIPLDQSIVGSVRKPLWVLLGAVGFVLLIACVNVANLLLVRASGRAKEIALRAALGAGRARLIRQLLTESLLLALSGGVGGVLLAMWGTSAFASLGPQEIPRVNQIHVDAGVLLFGLATSLATGILFGLAPALRASRIDLNDALKDTGKSTGGQSRNSLRNLLVTAEFALAFVLVVGAGLLGKSFLRLMSVNPGFDPRNVLTLNTFVYGARYEKPEAALRYYQQVLDRLRATPGIEHSALTSLLPLSGNFDRRGLQIQDRRLASDAEAPAADTYSVSPDYFQVMRIPLRRGRAFTGQDRMGAPLVAVISESCAKSQFPNQDPLGKHIQLGGRADDKPWMTIVGIVGDVRQYGLDQSSNMEVYIAQAQDVNFAYELVARTSLEPKLLERTVREAFMAVDKTQPVFRVTSLEKYLESSLAQRTFTLALLALFGALALALAAVGIYGVVSYTVSLRTREVGIRIALGADRRNVLGLILRQGLALTGAGLAAGFLASLALSRLLASMLYQMRPVDLATSAIVALVLSAAALAASYIPARRATRVDPMIALRYE
jgi:putative ABC transport system permease protein